MEGHPLSSDLNCIEHLWSLPKIRIYVDGRHFTANDTVREALQDAARSFPPYEIAKYTNSINKILFEVIPIVDIIGIIQNSFLTHKIYLLCQYMYHLEVLSLFFDIICINTSICKVLSIYNLIKQPYILPWFNEKFRVLGIRINIMP